MPNPRDHTSGQNTSSSPRFCGHCGRADRGNQPEGCCRACGDLLIPQGYCPVCEQFWRIPEGGFCPKHELKLESAPLIPDLASGGEHVSWTTVARFSDTLAAEAPRIRLEAEGIPTFVEGERMGGRSMYPVATGGVKLRVPESLAADAKIILSQTWSSLAAELDIEPEEWDEDQESTTRSTKLLLNVQTPDEAWSSWSFPHILLGLIVYVPTLVLLYLIIRWLAPS